MSELKQKNNLQSLANLVAEWANSRPVIATAYIFGSYVRGDAGPDSDLDLFIDFSPNPTLEATKDWTQQSVSDFPDLKSTIGVPISLHTRKDDAAWPHIEEAAKHPVLVVRKVVCCSTPRLKPSSE